MIFDRITSDPAVMSGQPCIRGTRVTVRRALEVAALYPDRVERQREFPELQDEDLRQALLFAASQLRGGSQTAGMTDEEFAAWMVAQGAQPMSPKRHSQLANSAGFGPDAADLIPPPAPDATMEEIEAWIIAIGGRELTVDEVRAWDEKLGRPIGDCPHSEPPLAAVSLKHDLQSRVYEATKDMDRTEREAHREKQAERFRRRVADLSPHSKSNASKRK
jgi:uncharacterized protein (DUF433 family)